MTQSVTQAQDTDTDTGPALPCPALPMPMPMPSSPSAPRRPSSSLPNPHPWDPLLLFCYYTYFYFVPIVVPSLVGQLIIPALGGSASAVSRIPPRPCSRRADQSRADQSRGLARCIPSYITAADLAHLGGEARAAAAAIQVTRTTPGCPARRSRPHPPPLGQPPRRQT